MPSGHSHAAAQVSDDAAHVSWRSGPSLVLLGLLGAALIATVVAVVVLWPSSDQVRHSAQGTAYAAPGVTFPHGRVSTVHPACPTTTSDSGTGLSGGAQTSQPAGCGTIDVTLTRAPRPVPRPASTSRPG